MSSTDISLDTESRRHVPGPTRTAAALTEEDVLVISGTKEFFVNPTSTVVGELMFVSNGFVRTTSEVIPPGSHGITLPETLESAETNWTLLQFNVTCALTDGNIPVPAYTANRYSALLGTTPGSQYGVTINAIYKAA